MKKTKESERIKAWRMRTNMPYVCKYDRNDPEAKSFELSPAARRAIETLASELCRQQRETQPEFAECWLACSWWIDSGLQLHMSFGGDAEDVDGTEADDEYADARLLEFKQ